MYNVLRFSRNHCRWIPRFLDFSPSGVLRAVTLLTHVRTPPPRTWVIRKRNKRLNATNELMVMK